MSHSVYFIGKHKRITAWCEAEVYEDDDKNPPTCITLYEIDEGGVRTQLETERHYESGYSGTFLCGYVYVPSQSLFQNKRWLRGFWFCVLSFSFISLVMLTLLHCKNVTVIDAGFYMTILRGL
ncbi:Uncharacterized protein Rs2_47755 [Raphanus sativus]|nr:Uncharacterized protein Rs2_47755 [Raphanus sativus]